ncbi:unnamed protein product [Symbiodinium sp. CCMP2592]|nr:unnamed protein product [Symbiodinium sp. CCMP2592]
MNKALALAFAAFLWNCGEAASEGPRFGDTTPDRPYQLQRIDYLDLHRQPWEIHTSSPERRATYDAGWKDDKNRGWQQDYEQWPRSPRGWSPRSRSRKGPKGKKDSSGKTTQPAGKGPGERRPDRAPQVPTVDQIPKPPQSKIIPAPKEQAAGSVEASAERKALETLLDHLGSQADIPDSVRAVMAQINQSSARSEAKNLHRLVAQRQEATATLEKIKANRASFDAGWAVYTQGLMDLLSKQFQEREEALNAMNESFASWAQRLAEASRALKTATNHGDGDSSGAQMIADSDDEDDDGMEAELDKNAQETARMETKRQALREQHQNLAAALAAVRDSASETAVKSEPRERTPRRKKDQAREAGDTTGAGGKPADSEQQPFA